ncbi:membrane protein insertase YidC [Ornithinimicrobium sediminis]|uniref:membrane protein insertase YidC n=1 Tax=Ornithinimicrobium sediminis TaxID=2904603 RepID=UPI001E5EED0D|nr:membrane protein insertase YidC [Ornithinimicrobium sediminis]MCE0486983.1 membrane protein insertase YidC [Ornithinimicrobium sediminis]
MGFFAALMYPFEWFVASILAGAETLLTTFGLAPTSGWTWALSIVCLVVVLRILLMPLFVRQIRAQRRMQLLQPELMKIQKKYKGKKDEASRKAMTEESFALYKKHGTNPFSSCLPILLQMPFFFALFRILNNIPGIADGSRTAPGFFTAELAQTMQEATLLGANLTSSFLYSDDVSAKVLSLVLIVAMSLTQFITSHQLMRKNMPAAALDSPMARQQQILIYVLPVMFAVFGVNFPLGVLIYWTTTNLWTMGQQFYVIRAMPAPGSLAEKALEERRLAKGKPLKKFQLSDTVEVEDAPEEETPGRTSGQRAQPQGKARAKKKKKKNNNRPKGR